MALCQLCKREIKDTHVVSADAHEVCVEHLVKLLMSLDSDGMTNIKESMMADDPDDAELAFHFDNLINEEQAEETGMNFLFGRKR